MLSIVEALGTGSSQTVAVPPYISKTHIAVYVDGLPTTAFTWATEQSIQLTVSGGQVIRVQRRTSPDTRLTDYGDGGTLPADVLDVDSLQAFYMAQEAYDQALIGGTVAPIPPGIELTTGELLSLLSGQITESQLATALRTRVELVDADGSVVGSPAWRVAQEAAARAGADDAVYNAAVAAVGTETTNRVAAVTAEQTARIAGDNALASSIDTVIASVEGNTAAIQEEATARADAITGVEAKYTIKVQARTDTKQAIAGIGLIATANDDESQSEMIFLADKFQFVPSTASVNDTPVPILQIGQVNGANTLIVPSTRLGDATVGARVVVDGAVEARHMKLTSWMGAALNMDPQCADPSAWVIGNVTSLTPTATNVAFTSGTTAPGRSATTYVQSTGSDFTDHGIRSKVMPVSPSSTYSLTARLFAASGNDRNMYIFVDFFDNTGTRISTAWGGTLSGYVYGSPPPTATFTKLGGQFGGTTGRAIPTNAVTMQVGVWMQYSGSGSSSVQQAAQDIRITEAFDASLVVEGGIDATRIDTRNLTIKDAAGNVIFSSGVNVDSSRVNPASGWLNSNISVSGGGALNGIGSGAGTVVANSAISVAGGNISGIGSGNGTAVANSLINVDSNGAIQGIGTGAGSNVANNATANNVTHIVRPLGGAFGVPSGAANGAIRITLPQGFIASMLRFYVDIYEYDTNASVTYEIGGFLSSSSGGIWDNAYARAVGNPSKVRPVRLGRGGAGKATVWIGNSGGSFAFPQVQVHDLVVGFNNIDIATWSTGWAVAMDTSAATNVSFTETLPKPGGAFSSLDQINSGNISTYIANAAIGTAQVNTLNASVITAGTITTDRLIANAATVVSAGNFDISTQTFANPGSSSGGGSTGDLALTSTGSPVFVSALHRFEWTTGNSAVARIEVSSVLKRDGVAVQSSLIHRVITTPTITGGATAAINLPFVVRDSPSAGGHTYRLDYNFSLYNSANALVTPNGGNWRYAAYITAMENKV